MKKGLKTDFQPRQHMLSRDFEIYYYEDRNLSKVDLHTHDYYEFYFFLEGDVQMQIGSGSRHISSGDMLLIPPRLPHRLLILNHEVPYRRFVFWISQDYLEQLIKLSPDYGYAMQYAKTHKKYIYHNDPVTFNNVQSMITRLIEETRSERFGKEAQISICVSDLVLHLNRLVYRQNHPRSPHEENTLCLRIIAYIDEHPDADLSLDRLAEEFFVSKYHIAHVFKDTLGISTHQYITKKRLALCKEAILGNMSIGEACRTFGFTDYSAFYHAFKKEYGISPKDFRETSTSIAVRSACGRDVHM